MPPTEIDAPRILSTFADLVVSTVLPENVEFITFRVPPALFKEALLYSAPPYTLYQLYPSSLVVIALLFINKQFSKVVLLCVATAPPYELLLLLAKLFIN